MPILDRVLSNVNICGVKLAFGGNATPSNISGWQPFYNSLLAEAAEKIYTTLATVNFEEESSTVSAGVKYMQKISFRLPVNDSFRAERIALLHTVKFMILTQSDGREIIIGRNDIKQNTAPSIKIKTNEQLAEVSFETVSIFPSGFVPVANNYGLPELIPLSF